MQNVVKNVKGKTSYPKINPTYYLRLCLVLEHELSFRMSYHCVSNSVCTCVCLPESVQCLASVLTETEKLPLYHQLWNYRHASPCLTST